MKKIAVWCCMCVCVFACLGMYNVRAENKELQFPSTAEEIADLLPPPPQHEEEGTGVLPSAGDASSELFGDDGGRSGGSTRGLATIVEDDKALENAPKTAALVLFDFNSASITEDSIPLLREYGKALQKQLADAVLVIGGHTDSKGSAAYNLSLSKQRAESVKEFLVSEFDIEESRLKVKAYGEVKPIESNETDDGRAKNRRVEFIRIK